MLFTCIVISLIGQAPYREVSTQFFDINQEIDSSATEDETRSNDRLYTTVIKSACPDRFKTNPDYICNRT